MKTMSLKVYRELFGCFQNIGILESNGNNLIFTYSSDYIESENPQPISHALPLQNSSFPPSSTVAFFDGILPEGSMRRNLIAAYRSEFDTTFTLISRLNNESSGALVFVAEGESPDEQRGYIPLDDSDFYHFVESPQEFTFQSATRSRLSIAGAQTKAGLFFDARRNTWCYPFGTAPSSHIVKACDSLFPGQTINEAICMRTALELGFETASCRLIDVPGYDPLIAVERFDRMDAGDAYYHRLHQEDFFQALPGFENKYEPTEANYANHCANLISEESINPFGDRRFFFSRLILDWLLGNADNHLKNHSFLWNADWSSKTVSPLYDLSSTTIYPYLDCEMGVSFGRTRRIDDVTRKDVIATASACGVGSKFAEDELDALVEAFQSALNTSTSAICEQGFPQAEELGVRIEESFLSRREKLNQLN